jgi:heparin/heparan-sulfate lyase
VVSTQPTFKKTWLLHSQNEPTIQANTISFESTQNGRNGRLHNTVLLPSQENQQIEKIGGPGKEYWVDGKNWGTVTQEDAGQWRVELSPKKAALSDEFLNVIQVMDAQPVQTSLPIDKCFSANGDYIAISIADRIVAQALNLANNQSREIVFSLGDTKKSYQVLITDLAPGKWLVQSANGKQIFTVNKDAGTIYITSKGGKFLLQKQ